MTQGEIAKHLGISRKSAQTIPKTFATTGSVLSKKERNKQKTGMPQKLDKTDERKMVRVSAGNQKFTIGQVRSNYSLNNEVSVDTVRRALGKTT